MIKPNPSYDLQTDADLSKFLLGAIRDLRNKEIELDYAIGISQLADKYTKNEVMRCLKAKMNKRNSNFNMEGEINKALLSKAADNDENLDTFEANG